MNTSNSITAQAAFNHRQVTVEGIFMHVVTAGEVGKPVILFLHGFPENWQAFSKVMIGLSDEFFTIAIDLPGIGLSHKIDVGDKRTIARYVKGIIDSLALTSVTLVGHDVGGMITYAYLFAYPDELEKAIIMNVVVPAIDPWYQVKKNPQIWHFAFHAIPDLPETLISGKQRAYFDYYYNTISAKPDKIDEEARTIYAEAYASYDALHTGLEWYRAFPQDEKDNTSTKGSQIHTPLLYVRGEKEYGNLDDYLIGFRDGGLVHVDGQLIPGSGHYAPEEAADEVINAIRTFVKS